MSPRSRSLLALALLVPAPTIGTAAALWIAPGLPGQTVYFIAKIWLLGLPLYWRLAVEKAPPSLSPPRRGGLLAGVLLGLLLAGAVVLAHVLVGRSWIDVEAFRARAAAARIGSPLPYVALGLYLLLVNSLLEEYVWRWFVFRRCEDLLPGAAAVVASALFFTVHHVLALRLWFDWRVTALASTGVFIGGAVWSACYLRYRSIWPCYLSHAIVDMAVLAIGWTLLFG